MTVLSRAYSRKNTRKFDKLRDLVYVHSKPTFSGEQSRLIRSTSPRPGSSWWSIRHAARIRQRVGSVPRAGQLATDSRWTRTVQNKQ